MHYGEFLSHDFQISDDAVHSNVLSLVWENIHQSKIIDLQLKKLAYKKFFSSVVSLSLSLLDILFNVSYQQEGVCFLFLMGPGSVFAKE